MVEAILVWTGAVLGVTLLLVMALGPVIVEVDSWWYERKLRKRARRAAAPKQQVQARRELARV